VGDKPVLSLPERVVHKTWRIFSGVGLQRETTAAYIRAFKRYRPEAVLAEYGTTGVQTFEACQHLGIPLIVHFHGFDASERGTLKEHANTYPSLFAEAAAIIAVSRVMERRLVFLGASPEKVHYNPCGVDCEEFKGAEPAKAPPIFLSVGRFVEKKAPHLTLKAFAAVQRAVPDARLRMIGDGALLPQCRTLAKELRIDEFVTFFGTQGKSFVQKEMQNVRCFVQHSVTAPSGDSEGTPVGVLEAGASGLPVVSTRHGGIPDVVIDGETGFLVDENDVDRMAERMTRMATSPGLAETLGLRARKYIQDNFSSERSLGHLWSIIESAIANKQQG
jgi:glycosyltransferase involved in cell wall biosynthesis